MTTTILRYAGFGKEDIFGDATEAEFHVNQASTSLEPPGGSDIVVPSGLGRMVRLKRPGYYAPAGGIEYPIDIDTVLLPLKWALNGYDFTAGGVGDPNTHEVFGNELTELESFTARLGKDHYEHVYTGCVLNTLALSASDGLATAAMGILAHHDEPDTIKDIETLLLPEKYPLAYHEVTACIADDDESSALATRVTLNIGNNINVGAARVLGHRHPYKFRAGKRDITATITLYFESLDMMELFWGNATGPVGYEATVVPFELDFVYSATRHMNIKIPSAYIDSIKSAPRGVESLTQEITLHTLMTEDVPLLDLSTVNTDILVTILNDWGTLLEVP